MVRALAVIILLVPLSAGARPRHRHHRRAKHARVAPRTVEVPPMAHVGRPAQHLNPEGIPGVGPAIHAGRQLAWNWRRALAP